MSWMPENPWLDSQQGDNERKQQNYMWPTALNL